MWQLFSVCTLAEFAFKDWNLCKRGEAQLSVRVKVRVDLYRAVFFL